MDKIQNEKVQKLNHELNWIHEEIDKYTVDRMKLKEKRYNMCIINQSDLAIEESIKNIVSELKKREKEIINILNSVE